MLYEYSYISYVIEKNTKGQRCNRGPIETLACVFLGPTRCYALVWTGGVVGSNSPRPYQERILPASGCNRSRGMSSGMSRRQGWKPAVILALWPEESKGQNDLFKLLHRE